MNVELDEGTVEIVQVCGTGMRTPSNYCSSYHCCPAGLSDKPCMGMEKERLHDGFFPGAGIIIPYSFLCPTPILF